MHVGTFERGNFSFDHIQEEKDCLHFTGPKVCFPTDETLYFMGFCLFNATEFSVQQFVEIMDY